MNEERATALLLLAEQADAAADPTGWFDRLEREHEDLLAALRWFLDRADAENALRLGSALYSYWHDRGGLQEGRDWLQRVTAAPGGSASIRAKALQRAGMLSFRSGDETSALALFEESLKIGRQAGDQRQVAATLLGLGRLVALRQGDYPAGHRLFEESLALAHELGDKRPQASAIHCLAALARLEGDLGRATSLYEQSLSLRRDLGDAQGVAVEQLNLGFMNYHRGNIETAAGLFAESLRSSSDRNDSYVMPPCLVGLAGIAVKSLDPLRAARILGAADALLRRAGLVLDPDDRVEYDRIASAVRTKLGDETMQAMCAEGNAMSSEQAIRYALDTIHSLKADNSDR